MQILSASRTFHHKMLGIAEEIPHRGCMPRRDGFETRPYHGIQNVIFIKNIGRNWNGKPRNY